MSNLRKPSAVSRRLPLSQDGLSATSSVRLTTAPLFAAVRATTAATEGEAVMVHQFGAAPDPSTRWAVCRSPDSAKVVGPDTLHEQKTRVAV